MAALLKSPGNFFFFLILMLEFRKGKAMETLSRLAAAGSWEWKWDDFEEA